MTWNIDVVIFLGFLIANLIFGLSSGSRISTIKEYAVGDRNFSTATIVATIVATWVSGEYFYSILTESYSSGLNFMWVAVVSDLVCLFVISSLFAPRMSEFLGKLSIAEAMGDLYGKNVRIVTAISSFIGVCGIIAVQLKIASMLFGYIGISNVYSIISAGFIVTIYSSLGGIKSVTFTDVIQFITFAMIIPMIAYILLKNIDNTEIVANVLLNNDLFDYHKVFDFTDRGKVSYLLLFVWSAIPAFNPAFFQRISMAKNVWQVRKSFGIAAITCGLLGALVCWIAILVLANHPNINKSDIVEILISDLASNTGFKGLLLSGVMAMILSTIDS